MIKDTVEYKLIAKHYGTRKAKRSKVPLINHIDEGLIVLDYIGATDRAKRAFCMHPLWQADADLFENSYMCRFVEPEIVVLTMEYRNIANAFLSDKMDDTIIGDIKLSPLVEVYQMLIADKVQNRKDFITYHKRTHDRSAQLDAYFEKWLAALNIDEGTYQSMCQAIDESKR